MIPRTFRGCIAVFVFLFIAAGVVILGAMLGMHSFRAACTSAATPADYERIGRAIGKGMVEVSRDYEKRQR